MPDETSPITGVVGSLRSVPVEIRVSVGRAHPTISDLLSPLEGGYPCA